MSSPNKRRDALEDKKATKRPKKECPYGEECGFRLSPVHFTEYSHKHLESILDSYSGSGDFPIPMNLLKEKQMYVDQLKIILNYQVYSPGKNLRSHQDYSTSSACQEGSSSKLEDKTTEDKNKEDKFTSSACQEDSSSKLEHKSTEDKNKEDKL